MTLIAFCSPVMGSGKSLAAQHLVAEHGFHLLKFADPLKHMTRALLEYLGYRNPDDHVEGALKEAVLWDNTAVRLRCDRADAALIMATHLSGHLGFSHTNFNRMLVYDRNTAIPGFGDLTLQRILLTLADQWIDCIAPEPTTPVTTRRIMQTLGTEWGRQLIMADFWTRIVHERATRLMQVGESIVIDDMRFRNELETVERLDGISRRILRPGLTLTGGNHASEGELDRVAMPEIWNDGTISEFYRKLDRLVEKSR